jgi:hypothetical protein
MSLKTPILEIEYFASGAITEGKIVMPGASDGLAAHATAATDLAIGIASHDAADGATVRVMLAGRAKCVAGGNITRGQKLTSGAAGVAVAAAPAAGVNNQIIGIALQSAVAGDLFSALLAQSVMQGA